LQFVIIFLANDGISVVGVGSGAVAAILAVAAAASGQLSEARHFQLLCLRLRYITSQILHLF